MKGLAITGFALMLVAALLFVAGSPTINLMPRNYANFGGIAAACLGFFFWVAYAMTRRPDAKDETE